MANQKTANLKTLSPLNRRRAQRLAEQAARREAIIAERDKIERQEKAAIARIKERSAIRDDRLARQQRRLERSMRAKTILLIPFLAKDSKSFLLPEGHSFGFKTTTLNVKVASAKDVIKGLRRRGLLREFGRIKWDPNVQAIKDNLNSDTPNRRLRTLKGLQILEGGSEEFTIDGKFVELDGEPTKAEVVRHPKAA